MNTTGTRAFGRLSALIVEDDDFMRGFLADMLTSLGVAHVKRARDGREGLQLLARSVSPPDLVLCDLHMPDTDGFQFMEMMAERDFKGGVILLSGLDERTLKSAALMARFHRLNILATMSKPLERRLLVDAMSCLVH